jgi:hypothetical protein
MSSNTPTPTPQPVLTYKQQKEQLAKLRAVVTNSLFADLLPKIDDLDKVCDQYHGK